MIINHLFNLVAQSLASLPQRIGSTWGGVFVAIAPFLVTQISLLLRGDGNDWTKKWEQWKSQWRGNASKGLRATGGTWLLLLIFSIAATIYDDHQDMVGATTRIKRSLIEQRQEAVGQRFTDREQSSKDIRALNTNSQVCAGVNRTLQQQNVDEQILIAGCQSEALKMLRPSERKISTHVTPTSIRFGPLGHENEYLSLLVAETNKTIPNVNATIECDRDFRIAEAMIANGDLTRMNPNTDRITPKKMSLRLESPAWVEGLPLVILLAVSSGPPTSCTVTQNP